MGARGAFAARVAQAGHTPSELSPSSKYTRCIPGECGHLTFVDQSLSGLGTSRQSPKAALVWLPRIRFFWWVTQ